jgi:hypothetical protein
MEAMEFMFSDEKYSLLFPSCLRILSFFFLDFLDSLPENQIYDQNNQRDNYKNYQVAGFR